MIIVTVGSQLRFDRLVKAVDEWCAASGRADVFGQIGAPGLHGYRPRHFEWEPFVAPKVFEAFVRNAHVIVAHAGMGCIISALMRAKPIVIMPRLAALGEHRNDHQVATAMRFANRRSIYVAYDETQLAPTLDRALADALDAPMEAVSAFADPELILSLRRFIVAGEGGARADVADAAGAANKAAVSR